MPGIIGNLPSQVPTNGDLGDLAFQNADAVKRLVVETETVTNQTVTNSTVTNQTVTNPQVDTAISDIRPSLLLDFAKSKTLDPRITFTRGSTATYYNGKTVAKAEENLVLYSQEFNNAAWTKSRSTITADATTAPDGTLTAELLSQATGQTSAGVVFQLIVQSAPVVVSVYAKASTKSLISILTNTGGNGETWFNLANGTVGTTGSNHTATITSVGNGWYRCSVLSSVTSASQSIYVADTDGSRTVTDSGGVFIWGAQFEARSSVTAYTPTTTQPITNYIPVLLTAQANVARFEHNPVTSESLGLEIEEQRTNLLTYSEQFNDASWTLGRATIQANVIVAPDGTLTGDKLVEDTTASNTHVIFKNGGAAGAHTFSVCAKAAERTRVQVTIENADTIFDVSNGTVVSLGSATSATATPVGNGWYRLSVVRTLTAASNAVIRLVQSGTTTSYTGDGFSGIYIWGAQLEAGAFPTSYIPTVASQVTRSADSAVMTGTNFSSWYRADEGTIYTAVNLASTPATGPFYLYAIHDNTVGERIIALAGTGSGGNINALVTDNGAIQAQTIAWLTFNGSLATAGFYKYANAYKVNDFVSVANGGTAVTDTLGTLPTVDRLNIGSSVVGTIQTNGAINKLAYYPKRLTNAELQEMTI